MNPYIQSGLIETASAPGSDAPRAGIVLIPGTAGSGPTQPVEFERPSEAYRVYGTDGDLARSIELALLGATYGASVAGTGVTGRVIGLRLETGTRASASLVDGNGNEVIRIESVEASARANGWKVQETSTGYRVYDPVADTYTDIAADKNGAGIGDAARTPTSLTRAINRLFDGKIVADIDQAETHFEIKITDQTDLQLSGAGLTTTDTRTELNLTGMNATQMAGITSGASTWIDGVAPHFAGAGTEKEVHKSILSESNEDARIYAITTGKLVAAPQGANKVVVDKLGDAKRIGLGLTNSILNVRALDPGADDIITLKEAGEITYTDESDGTTEVTNLTSEAYWRVRQGFAGRFDLNSTGTQDFGSGDTDDTYVFTFSAPAAIDDTDEAGSIAAAFAVERGIDSTDAALVSTDKMGDRFADTEGVPLKLWARAVAGAGAPVEIPLDFTAQTAATATGVRADVTYAGGVATLILAQEDLHARHGIDFDEAFMYVSYDSCIFEITEMQSVSQLDATATDLQYCVVGNSVEFNRALEHELAFRGLRVTQYRLGSDVVVERDLSGNTFVFHGRDNQPGAAGGKIDATEVVLGFNYTYEPDWPVLPAAGVKLSGGSAGANASPEQKIAALKKALGTYKDQNFKILCPSGIYLDDVRTAYDSMTGVAQSAPVNLIGVLQDHIARVSHNGAAGVVYASVKPMQPSTTSGLFTDEQKRRRFEELVQSDAFKPTRAATLIQKQSLPDFFVFDAPMAVALNGETVITDGAAFFAGIRSALPNNRALYQLELPPQVQPLYRYDLAEVSAPGVLAEARINTWADRRGEVRLADERTAAGLVADAKGNLVPSSFMSGVALLVAKDFLARSTQQLKNLLGPVPSGGADVLRGTVETMLRSIAAGMIGVQALSLDANRDITIRSVGGNALGLYIRVFLQVNGELRVIEIKVGAVTEATVQSATVGAIPVAG